MVQELKVTCPHCHQVAEIFLSTNACVIILNCPSCYSPIMSFDQKIFILSDNQVEAIRNRVCSSAMINMLKKMAQHEALSHEESSPCNKGSAASFESPSSSSACLPSSAKIHIGTDEITNLKIDLALCNDVSEFIDRI